MDRTRGYRQNAEWLTRFAPFRALSVSAAYLAPFFLEKGLTLSEMFLLQSIFSGAILALEVPSGRFADKYGRAFSLKLAAAVGAVGLLAYGFCDHFWQFMLCEVVMAVANALISGVDDALLYDSLLVQGYQGKQFDDLFTGQKRRIDAYGFYAVSVGSCVGAVLAGTVGVSATLIADGLLSLGGVYCMLQLVEPPRYNGGQAAARLSARQAVHRLGSNVEARWLVALGAMLIVSTHLAFWLSAPYYTSLGIPAVLFGAILAFRNLWKGWLAHPPRWFMRRYPAVYRRQLPLELQFWLYGLLAGLVYLAMASGQLWLVWAVLGHDVVHALHKQPVTTLLNARMVHDYRATLNSVVSLVQRLVFTAAGPMLGWLVDARGLATGFVVTGLTCSAVAVLALTQLHRLKTFR